VFEIKDNALFMNEKDINDLIRKDSADSYREIPNLSNLNIITKALRGKFLIKSNECHTTF
jgi:hypothetical protein